MPRSLNAWSQEKSGTGAITVAGFKATLTTTGSPADSRAYLRRTIFVPPGSVVEMKAMCRRISGDGGMRIDFNAGNVLQKSIEHSEMQEMTCRVVVPYSDSTEVEVYCNIGTFADNPVPSSIEVFDPRVYVDGIEVSLIPLPAARTGSGDTLSVKFTNGEMTQRGTKELGPCTTTWGSVFTTGNQSIPAFPWEWVGRWEWDSYVTSSSGATTAVYRASTSIGGMRGASSPETFSAYVVARGRWY